MASMWGNDLVSTPAASRGGTAQTTPRASASQSALKKQDKQVLPSVAAALSRDKGGKGGGGISFMEPDGNVFEPNRYALRGSSISSWYRVNNTRVVLVLWVQ
jgi:hypothetical protein